MFGRGSGSRTRKADRRRAAGGLLRFGWKRGSSGQRRCAVAMHKFRFWLYGQPLITSERDRASVLADLHSAAREFPGCVPARYWRLVEDRIRALPLDEGEWD